ncbi:MAG TPA: SPFH domain-containing protein, partial [Verrucomicrobiales bacterium]|nr:SPFH domain-containing protein [Verrucomicrobiales bacterium]
MLGFRYIKFDPTQHVIVFKSGRATKEGPGLAFWYFAPSTSLVSIPLGSTEAHFIFQESTADYQEVTIQGQVTYRISDPKKAAALLNHTLDNRGERYVSKDP